ncbi:PhoH family protein [Gammaproteobacteria bacterium]|jgi:phosphate starvation-inducible PhoH-like protein|nr:PhoH family protein [Gammaproteobacteria bacterium]MDC0028632.1 PhoH family protein [Gammaproteobacteria bacterium]
MLKDLKFQLEPADQDRITSLCGPTNSILKQIEEALDIKIINRGANFKIKGPVSELNIGKTVITKLYNDLEKVSELSPSSVHLYLREAINNSKREKNMENSLASKSPIKTPNLAIIPNGSHQQEYIETINKRVLTFGIGPAGTGKTYLAVASAVQQLVSGEVEKILLVRPAVEAGEKLGFLPGDLSQKVDPYLRPLYDALFEMLGFKETNQLIERNIIEVVPLAFMRGRTLNDSFIILDESQNATVEQMKMFLTRFGFGSKVVVTGDITQIDLPKNTQSGLVHSLDVLKGLSEVGFIKFDSKDIVRHGLVQKIVEAYEEHN